MSAVPPPRSTTIQSRHQYDWNPARHAPPVFTLIALHSRLAAFFIDFCRFLPMLQCIEGLFLDSPRSARRSGAPRATFKKASGLNR